MLTLSDECTLHALLEKVSQKSNNFLGFPVSKDFDYLQLMPFLQYPFNNLGDPFVESTYGVDTREIEKEVIHFFADLIIQLFSVKQYPEFQNILLKKFRVYLMDMI